MEGLSVYGPTKLCGEVNIGGSKNSLSAILPAFGLKDESAVCTLEGVPDLEDTITLCNILCELGLVINRSIKKRTITVMGKIQKYSLGEENVTKIRASSLFLGVLLAMCGKAEVPFCGGDKIGERPLDIHMYVLEKFGAEVKICNGIIHCRAKKFPLQGAVVFLRYPSVGATETAILLAARAVGDSYIYNAACEPEITDLAVALNSMGARITGAGTPIIHIKGVDCLGDVQHELIPDRIECATYLLGFAITRGSGKVNEVIPEHNMALISLMRDIGVKLQCNTDSIEIDATYGKYNSIQADALPYPGMATDIQPILSTLAVMCTGNSMIRDSVFVDRFQHLGEYQKMGIITTKSYNQIYVTGPQDFQAATVIGEDIRTATSLALGAMSACGRTDLYGYEHIRRGYESFVNKMNSIGAEMKLSE